jgi:mono/diheme cytochrome c family protein
MRGHVLLAAATLLLAVTPVAARSATPDPAAGIKAGKALFEKSCKLCHGLDRALVAKHDAAAWGEVVKRMVAYGAPLGAEQRALVVRYLAARSAFAGKCSGCHELTRVVGDAPVVRNWAVLTERMAGHARESAKQGASPAAPVFSPGELAEIAALLQAVIP